MYRLVDHATSFKEIELRLVDTAALPANVFVKDIDLINTFAKHSHGVASMQALWNRQRLRYAGHYYFGSAYLMTHFRMMATAKSSLYKT